jgi:hypothetical protein
MPEPVPTIKRRAFMLSALAAPLAPPSGAAPVSRGVNIADWFRFPARADPASLRAYLSDQAIAGIAAAGFSHVRLPVTPEAFDPGLVAEGVLRLQARGLATMVAPSSSAWRLETSAADRDALVGFWSRMAPALGAADAGLTLPEVCNEPVFADDQAGWEALQARALAAIRAALPDRTAVLTGGLWGGIDGLLRLRPSADARVIYSVHCYEPAELTSLAAYYPGLDRDALAALPFPAGDAAACRAAVSTADATADATTRAVAGYYCGLGWNAARLGARMDQAAAWSAANGPVILGEFGASSRLNAPARLAWLSAMRQAAEARGIPWTLWAYDDAMGLGVARPPPARPALDAATLAALGLRAP